MERKVRMLERDVEARKRDKKKKNIVIRELERREERLLRGIGVEVDIVDIMDIKRINRREKGKGDIVLVELRDKLQKKEVLKYKRKLRGE